LIASERYSEDESMPKTRQKAVATLQIDNERVRVTQWSFAPGAQTGWHKHQMDYVVVPELQGTLLLETSAGESTSALNAGVSYYRTAGVEHNVINANSFAFSFVEIELKGINNEP